MAAFFVGGSTLSSLPINTAPQFSDLYAASYSFSALGSKPFR